MSRPPFRFVHAADLHLERPLHGVAEVPPHLQEAFLDSPYWAAERVFQTVLAEQADFLILAGDVLDPYRTGPRGPVFLLEQFRRLAERGVAVYWAGGRVDPPDAWPAPLALPSNVHMFPPGQPEKLIHRRDAEALACIVGLSWTDQGCPDVDALEPDPTGLTTIAVVPDAALGPSLLARQVHYWALGGGHKRRTWADAAKLAHDPGSPQARSPAETGVHGCTLVEVDPLGSLRSSLVSTHAVRWEHERVVVDPSTTRAHLESRLADRLHALLAGAGSAHVLVSWTVAGTGPLVRALRRGSLASEILNTLRERFGFGNPAVWSISLDVEPADLPADWYDQDTLRGDFLRAVRDLSSDPEQPLGLEASMAPSDRESIVGMAAAIEDAQIRQRVLAEAALLGADLLSGEDLTL